MWNFRGLNSEQLHLLFALWDRQAIQLLILQHHAHPFGRLLSFALGLQALTPDQESMWTVRPVRVERRMLESKPVIIAKVMAEKKGLGGNI